MSNPLALKEADLRLMLAANMHIGTKNCSPGMKRYVWRRRMDGIYILNLGKTWEKIVLAARVIVAIENPEDVCVISGRNIGQRAVFKYAQHTGAQYIGGRYTPGTLTNQCTREFKEPRIIVCTDPHVDHQPIFEAAYVNIPTLTLADSDSSLKFVDIAIPCNNKSKHSVALVWWLLAREVNRLRALCSRVEPWNVMMDLFIFRDMDEQDDIVAKQISDEQGGGDAVFDAAAGGDKVAEWGAPEVTADQQFFGSVGGGTGQTWEEGQAAGTY